MPTTNMTTQFELTPSLAFYAEQDKMGQKLSKVTLSLNPSQRRTQVLHSLYTPLSPSPPSLAPVRNIPTVYSDQPHNLYRLVRTSPYLISMLALLSFIFLFGLMPFTFSLPVPISQRDSSPKYVVAQ